MIRSATWERAGRRLLLRPMTGPHHAAGDLPGDTPGETWRLCPSDAFGARSLLRDFVTSDQDFRRLREVTTRLAPVLSTDVSREQLINTVAELIAHRRMALLESVRPHGMVDKPRGQAPATMRQAGGMEGACTPAQLRGQMAPDPPPSAGAAQPPVEDNFIENVAHDTQAVALKSAAATGVPFCELCEKARAAG